jgi:metal-responsive CopG/Arc/MetJ family transcriptional regulator
MDATGKEKTPMKKTYTEKFALKLPNEIQQAIEKAASSRYMSRSEFIRQAVIEKLEKELNRPKIAA